MCRLLSDVFVIDINGSRFAHPVLGLFKPLGDSLLFGGLQTT